MLEIEYGLKLAFLALVWVALSSPLLFAAVVLAKCMKRRRQTSRAIAASFGCVVAVLLAPVPTPIITVFVPNGLALIQREYYAGIFEDGGFYSQLLPWVCGSVAVTVVVCVRLSLRFFSSPSNASPVAS